MSAHRAAHRGTGTGALVAREWMSGLLLMRRLRSGSGLGEEAGQCWLVPAGRKSGLEALRWARGVTGAVSGGAVAGGGLASALAMPSPQPSKKG